MSYYYLAVAIVVLLALAVSAVCHFIFKCHDISALAFGLVIAVAIGISGIKMVGQPGLEIFGGFLGIVGTLSCVGAVVLMRISASNLESLR